MRRREFLSAMAALGLMPMVPGCASSPELMYQDFDVEFRGKTLVLGAGAAGLAAGYMLARYGADYEILEASDAIGGRVRKLEGFMDFPIDLGAEWIHSDPGLLARLIDDDSVQGSIDTIRYNPQTLAVWNGEALRAVNAVSGYYGEYKFRDTTWFDFLETWIAPASEGRIRLETQVFGVDTSGARARVALADGTTEETDRIIIAVPLKILQSGALTFTPQLPAAQREAIDAVTVTDGLKVFVEFEEQFFADVTVMGALSEEGSTDHLAIDGAFRKGSERHLLTLFCVGAQAIRYVNETDERIVELLLSELDAAYDGAATRSFKQAHVQNWSKTPHIMGAYPYAWDGDFAGVIAELARDVDARIFWAGTGYSVEHTSTVHGAMESAYAAVRQVLETPG